ncbi:S8 family peptidase [Dactylosporangium darangshiense]|uniref:S8 family peptidase n=1 Tax=Dactylosporangium darangshiense TaxID=579108 RepID=UPI0036397E84
MLVARSTNPSFATAVSGAGVDAVASTAGLGTALEDSATVEVADPAAQQTTGDPTGEPLFGQQWDMTQINVPQAHKVTTGSPNVVVGVLDSGISSTHPDLATQIAKDKSASCIGGAVDTAEAAWNPTTSDHGTHVAGTIAAAINGIGVAGVAPGVKVASVKVVNDDGFIYPEAAVCGFLWAADHGMQITNNSYFIDPWECNCRNDVRQRPVWTAVQRAIRYSQNKGVLNIASAGNSNVDLQHKFVDAGSPNDGSFPVEDRTITGACLDLPAEAPGVVTVSAVGPTRLKSYYSSYGQGVVDVAAPGGDTRFRNLGSPSTLTDAVLSTTFNTATKTNGWGYKQGTSMAGPHAVGVAALALSAHPGMQPGALASWLERTADALACPSGVYNPVPLLQGFEATCSGGNRNGFYGAGEVNAYNPVR